MTTLFDGITRTATISPCGKYRYRLHRSWDVSKPLAAWIMLNPSTADASLDDATIRKCMAFSKRWGGGGIIVANLFAYRATDPVQLKRVADPIGPENDDNLRAFMDWVGVGPLIAAWGTGGGLQDRDIRVMQLLQENGKRVMCLNVTKDGFPNHPLYMRMTAKPVPYEGRKARAA